MGPAMAASENPLSGPSPQAPDSRIFQTLDRCGATVNYTRGELIGRMIWQLIQATLFRLPLLRGYAWRRFLLRMFGAKLGQRAGVHSSTRIMHPWLLEMGDWTMIGPNATVYNLGKITIGRHTVVSQGVYLCAGTHDYTRPDLPLIRPEIRIGAGVWVAAEAFVGPGVVIGDNSVIGARSVVVSEIAPGVVAAGNPCRVIKPRDMRSGESSAFPI
jgi:putative colanic acid biosynthesis acetyltransferase WcaF